MSNQKMRKQQARKQDANKQKMKNHAFKKREEKIDEVLKIIALAVVVLNIAQTMMLTIKVSNLAKPAAFASQSASLSLCINHPPTVNLSNCSTVMVQDEPYSCLVTAQDIDMQNIVFTSTFINETDLFNISQTGWINYTPNASAVGNHSMLIMDNDNSGCENSQGTAIFKFRVLNVNDPPILLQPLPTPQELYVGSVLVAFYLDDYFWDPDIPQGDYLTYVYSITNNASINITIESDSRVKVTGNSCPVTATVVFTAIDSFGASNNSNVVTFHVNCITQPSQGSAGTSSGGGSGGGGAMFTCIPKWECGSWQPCLPNGTQYRRCVDKHACDPDNYIKYLWRNCTYYAQCANGIQDPNEEGIDCGGPCPPCANCSDGIQNCHDGACEEGIDCGGPCPPCPSCNDGIKNCHDGACEEGIDCGGPCPPCASCSDGIQNCHDGACEEGIDCGGPCPPCKQVEAPVIVPDKYRIPTLIAAITLLIGALLIVLYQYYHPFKKKKPAKQVLLSRDQALSLGLQAAKVELSLEHMLGKHKNPWVLKHSVLMLYQEYFAMILGIDKRSSPREALQRLKTLTVSSDLKNVLRFIVEQVVASHKQSSTGYVVRDGLALKALIEEFKALLVLTAPVNGRELSAPALFERFKLTQVHKFREHSYELARAVEAHEQHIVKIITTMASALKNDAQSFDVKALKARFKQLQQVWHASLLLQAAKTFKALQHGNINALIHFKHLQDLVKDLDVKVLSIQSIAKSKLAKLDVSNILMLEEELEALKAIIAKPGASIAKRHELGVEGHERHEHGQASRIAKPLKQAKHAAMLETLGLTASIVKALKALLDIAAKIYDWTSTDFKGLKLKHFKKVKHLKHGLKHESFKTQK